MTWGPAQAGVASGVAEAVAQEIVFDIEERRGEVWNPFFTPRDPPGEAPQ